MIELGIPEEDAGSYERQIEVGRTLLLLECKEMQRERVIEIFAKNGALNV
ncbi:hypothetical protein [Paenibacillus sp. DMB20]|nr:hypothetical protein [Paenibacillus sp. DMB20]